MSEQQDKVIERQMYILQLVRTNPDIIVDDLVRMTGVGKDTVQRDLWWLRQAFPGIRKLRRKKVVLTG